MNSFKPALPRGTRDFSPELMVKRNYILNTIKATFEKYGFLPLETPALENLSVLTGKYGDEGDQLIYRILNSGNFLSGVREDELATSDHNILSGKISEKGLRYDLTVPFARYVVMNRNDIIFPFKRYQIQPVWRADRPQKGRYREFYQCDADVIGSDSLICEAEIVIMVQEVFSHLDLSDYIIKINSRKILEGIAETAGDPSKAQKFFVILDKLDKIGKEKFKAELAGGGFSEEFINNVSSLLEIRGNNKDKLDQLRIRFKDSRNGSAGVNEVQQIFDYVESFGGDMDKTEFDMTLARGLTYYTGVIFETKATRVKIGSIGGGGRYDNLTGVFGLPDMSGVGFSFGIDRIYDVLEEMQLFHTGIVQTSDLLIANFDPNVEKMVLRILTRLRKAGIRSEIYPDPVKLKKQLNYANKRNIPYVLMVGSEELKKGVCTLKDMEKGEQHQLSVEGVIEELKKSSKRENKS